MTILLDSHTVVWFLTGNPRCSARARKAIEDEAGDVFVSAASAWEIATKVRLGRWPDASQIVANMSGALAEHDFSILDVRLEHALLAGSFPNGHGDPFDRMLVAQAEIEKLPLVTADPVFRTFAIETLW